MDATDQKLLSLLRRDARLSIATLAIRLGVSRGTVTNRIKRLEDDGIIVGYTVRVRPDVQQDVIKAWMSIAVEGNQTRVVIASLLGEPNVARHQWAVGSAGRIASRKLAGTGEGAGTDSAGEGNQQHRNKSSSGDLSVELRVGSLVLKYRRVSASEGGPQPRQIDCNPKNYFPGSTPTRHNSPLARAANAARRSP
jgi:DNA-binding Lrp family transcriptional regulator